MKQLILIAAIGASAMAYSQAPLINTNGLSIRLGGVYPLESNTRAVTKNMIAIGLDFDTPTNMVKGGKNYISFDWYGKSGSGAKGNMFPIMYNVRFGDEPGKQFYTFAGVGIVFMDVTKSKTVFGLRGGIGTKLSQHVFAEAAAVFSGDANGAKANSIGAFVGYKF